MKQSYQSDSDSAMRQNYLDNFLR